MKTPKSMHFERLNKIVTVGDVLHVKWDSGKEEDYKIKSFCPVSNLPMSESGKKIYLDYVDWTKSVRSNDL